MSTNRSETMNDFAKQDRETAGGKDVWLGKMRDDERRDFHRAVIQQFALGSQNTIYRVGSILFVKGNKDFRHAVAYFFEGWKAYQEYGV